ncbi:hypothetical protein B0H13DRAFT_1897809 [Mycena leptocephala]|nr:hypothetical protein B0H13DRAFT_1897809 [Mycena leptocephala]
MSYHLMAHYVITPPLRYLLFIFGPILAALAPRIRTNGLWYHANAVVDCAEGRHADGLLSFSDAGAARRMLSSGAFFLGRTAVHPDTALAQDSPDLYSPFAGLATSSISILREFPTWSAHHGAVVAGVEDSQGIARQSTRRAVVNRGCDGGRENLEDVLVAEQRRDMFVVH